MPEEIKCIHCESKNNYKKGYRKTLNRGKIQSTTAKIARGSLLKMMAFIV
jgi:hypothetical protein